MTGGHGTSQGSHQRVVMAYPTTSHRRVVMAYPTSSHRRGGHGLSHCNCHRRVVMAYPTTSHRRVVMAYPTRSHRRVVMAYLTVIAIDGWSWHSSL